MSSIENVTGRGPASDAGESQPGSVQVIVQDARTRIVLSGEIDADLAPDLQDATSDAEATGLPIDIDAQHVTFMDSSGIAFLARIATRSGSRIRVIRPPETVRFLLEVTRIGELLDVVTDDDDAADAPSTEEPDHGLPTIGPAGRSRRSTSGPDDVA
ncbi:STAS domain-containing protein [Actinotalea sp. AC32]|nr:STAS domain-containing protein [Actinotalea sp. AC32]